MKTDQDQDFILGRIRNQTNTGSGSVVPPKMLSGVSVPVVNHFRVVKREFYFGGTEFTLAWEEPEDKQGNLSHFHIYAVGAMNSKQPIGPITTRRSPVQVRIVNQESKIITFKIQTVLKNGYSTEINDSPTCTGNCQAAKIATSDIPPGTITFPLMALQDPGTLLTWDAASEPVALEPGSLNDILVSMGPAAEPQYASTTTLNIPLGASALVTPGAVIFAAAAAGNLAADASSFFWDDTNNYLGIVTNVPKSSLDVYGSRGAKVVSKVFSDSPYTAGNEDVILCDCTAGNIIINLPAKSGVPRRIYHIKKIDSSANTITVDADGSETIDGATTQVISVQYDCIEIVCGSSEWSII